MTGLARDTALDRVEELITTVESDPMPVPIREIWLYGDLALGLDPVERLDVYLTKDLLFGRETDDEREFPVDGVGQTVDADWAEAFPEHLRANENGHAAPARCLAAHLVDDGEPIHLEVCNTGFEDNITQRLAGARARDSYRELLDPRGVCLWLDGHRSPEALDKLRAGEYVFPTLADALEMLGLSADEAATAADAVRAYREQQDGATVRGDVV